MANRAEWHVNWRNIAFALTMVLSENVWADVLMENGAMMRRLLLVVAALGIMGGCKERFEKYYPSAAAAVKAGEFDRGWLPNVLKPDVTDIRLWYDIDSNEVRGKFALNERVLTAVQTSCKSGIDLPRKTRSMPKWFPVTITSVDTGAHGIRILRCEGFFVATDTASATGYFWH